MANLYDEPVWIQSVKYGHKICIPRGQLIDHKKKLDDNGDHLFVECEPEFVPKIRLNPVDDDKKESAKKYTNTELTLTQIETITKGTHAEIDAFAKKEGVALTGCKTKKDKLEKLEDAGVLY